MSTPDPSFTPTHFQEAIQPAPGPSRWVKLNSQLPTTIPLSTPIQFIVADINPNSFLHHQGIYLNSQNGKFNMLNHPSTWNDCIRGYIAAGHDSRDAGERIAQSIQDIRNDRRMGSELVGNNLGLLALALIHAYARTNSVFWSLVLREAENAMVAPGISQHGILGVFKGDTRSLQSEIAELVFPNGEDLFRDGAVYFAWTREGGFTWLNYEEGDYWYKRHETTRKGTEEGGKKSPMLSGWENVVPREDWR